MAPVGTLWGTPRQPFIRIILTVAILNDLELQQREISTFNKPAEFTEKFPYGKVPAFEGSDEFKLIEGVTIARYLCTLGTKVKLLGSDEKESILVDQWIHFAEHEIGSAVQGVIGQIFGFFGAFSREVFDKHIERLARAMKHVESYLATRSSGYLVSDSVTLADFVVAGMVYGAAFAALGAAERAQYPTVFAHYARVTEDERVKQFWGTKEFVDVAITEPRARAT